LNADKLRTQDDSAFFRNAMARMAQRGGDNDDMMGGRERVEIHRDQIYSDSMNQLNKLGRRLKSKIQVTMINKHGNREAGIDGGGVFQGVSR
jgi:ubiquitin-protein ligase E3 C